MKILIVVDVQNDFVTGSLGTPEAQAIVPRVKDKVAEAIVNGDIVIYTRDTHFDGYLDTREGKKLPVIHCVKDTEGWEIVNGVYLDGSTIVDKYTFGAYGFPNLIADIANGEDIEEIELVGLCTDICVISNALLLKSAFYAITEVSVDATCCAGVTPETHEAALKTMEMCQINVKRG